MNTPSLFRQGFCQRHVTAGHLVTTVASAAETNGLVELRTLEAGHDTMSPTLSHADTHMFLYVLDGLVELLLDGDTHQFTNGDAANIPAGTAYRTRVVSGSARWIATSSGGNGGTYWDRAGTPEQSFSHPVKVAAADAAASLTEVDVVVA